MPLLEVQGLVKRYGRRTVVNGVGFGVDAGEVVGLLGPNGAGKTTSFRMATGMVTPNAGIVTFAGQNVTRWPMYKRARLGMGYLSQESSIFRKLSVEQNILAILEAMPQSRTLKRKLTSAERWQRTRDVLEQFGLSRLHRNISQTLSGGEKRRLEIARCLVCEPLLILLDEPFTGIDPITISEIQVIVLQLRDSGIGLLLTDHNVREALKITDRSYVITDGVVEAHGTPKEIVEHPIVIKRYLGEGFAENDFTTRRSAPQLRPVHADEMDSEAAANLSHKASIMHHADPEPIAERKAAGSQHLRTVLEQERIRDLVEKLKTAEHVAAERELLRIGRPALPMLSEALERKDIDLRRMAFHVLQQILPGVGTFDPYAPEAQRRHQIERLREVMFRKAG